MEAAKDLRNKFVSKAIRNVQRGYTEDDKSRGMFRPEVRLDLQRSRLMTESFKKTDGQAMVLRRAKAFAHVLENMDIFIQDWERIVGYQTADRNGIYHPIDQNWRSVLRLVNSEAGKSLLNDTERAELDEICAYWKGKSMSDRQQELFTGDLDKYWKYEGTFLWTQFSDMGLPDYERLLGEGITARINRAKARIEEIDKTTPFNNYVDQKEFLQSVVIALEAVIKFAHRYAELAKKMAKAEKDPDRKKQLEEVSRTCQWVPANTPRTFMEAVQFFYFLHLIRYIEFASLTVGLRVDYVLGPYYEKDIKEGRIKREEALEILQLLWIKFLELGLVYSPLVTSVYGGVASLQALTLGGLDRDGRDVTNDLTYLTLEAAATMRTNEPSIALRVHKNTPEKLLSAATDVVRTGIGYPSFLNDEVIIPLLEKWGASPEEAKGYSISGCVYLAMPGKNCVRRTSGYFVVPKCLWWALHQGKNPETDEQRGAKTPDPAAFKSWEDVLEAYLTQVKFFASKMVQLEATCRDIYAKYCPRPYYSAILEDCIEKGKDLRSWEYESMIQNFIMVIGSTNVADSLTAIKKVIFEDKRLTLPELIKIMDKNWEGHEDIRQACLNAPKYGNDDDYADLIAREVHHRTEATMETVKTRFGFPLRGDGSAVTATYGLAHDTPATPDGRMSGGYFADSTLAPQPGMDKNGPTAVLNSCAKIDTLQTYNHLLNQKFLPQYLDGDMRPVFLSYLKTWRDKKISQIQFNVVDKKTLLAAQQYPEKYKDLIVRVAGFSAYFADLSKGLQDHIIARTAQELR